MPVTCPAGHQSSTADYCDTCGAAIAAAPKPGGAGPPPAAAAGSKTDPGPATQCPECGTPHQADDAFCEVCGLDFATGARPAPPPPPQPASAESETAAPPSATTTGWTATIEVDPAFFATNQADDPSTSLALPTDPTPRHLDLSSDEVLVGRRSSGSGPAPQLDLGGPAEDPGVSHRHAVLTHHGDSWTVTDLRSTNGTRVGASPDPIEPGVPVPLGDGDYILVGVWTRITLHRSRGGGA